MVIGHGITLSDIRKCENKSEKNGRYLFVYLSYNVELYKKIFKMSKREVNRKEY